MSALIYADDPEKALPRDDLRDDFLDRRLTRHRSAGRKRRIPRLEKAFKAQNLFLEKLVTQCSDDERSGREYDNTGAFRDSNLASSMNNQPGKQENICQTQNRDVKHIYPVAVFPIGASARDLRNFCIKLLVFSVYATSRTNAPNPRASRVYPPHRRKSRIASSIE